ncbi:MAG: hypothetical protein R3D58_18985 [Saprospiraceae bacterium]|nr:hypothetical protein [Lewinellaceae bacterium]
MLRTLLLLLVLAGLNACRNQTPSSSNVPDQAAQTTQAAEVKLPSDFMEFYQKFHRDSLYQMAHIAWPLQGDASVKVDSTRQVKQATSWEPKDWIMHRPVDFSTSEFVRNWELLGDELIIERIRYAAANYGLERRFMKQFNGEWELIYYSDMQEVGR